MASLAELARQHTGLDGAHLAHLQRLVASWGPLADLCFADLVLFAPVEGEGSRFVVVAQVRPTTHQTVYRFDLVGQVFDDADRPLVARAFRTGEMTEGEFNLSPHLDRVRVLAIPVCTEGKVVGVCTRESMPTLGRAPGELERIYVEVFLRFARMIAAGEFPFAAQDVETEESPRVGDGVLVLDDDGRVEYASPNAVSALHRIGVHANAVGMRLGELGLDEVAIRTSFAVGVPVTEEIERGQEVTVVVRCLPLLDDERVTGALVLLRDISELRRRDRLLTSKDMAIREIHHRVKNNLQTISSLLRLQGRRLESKEAKVAIEESVRRIRSIALVHETLSREAGDDVVFAEIVRPLVRMVEEGLLSPERPVRFTVEGEAGLLPARVATPLAVVLTELLQNAVEHGFPEVPDDDAAPEGHATARPGNVPAPPGNVIVRLVIEADALVLQVADDGVGLPEGFSIGESPSLGLAIVRTLTSQVDGSLSLRDDDGRGTLAEVRVPLGAPVAAGS